MRRESLLAAVAVFAVGVGLASARAGAEGPALRFAAKDIDPGSIMSPVGDYAAALGDAAKFPAERRLTVRGAVIGEDGKPVSGIAVLLFPLGSEGPTCVLGTVGRELTFANPRATTDAAGRFSISAGPLWEFDQRAVLGLLVRRAPDRPFDVGVRAVEDANGTKQIPLDAAQKLIDLGAITLAFTPPE